MRVLAAYRGILFVRVWNAPISLAREGRESKTSLFYEIYPLSPYHLNNLLIYMHAITMSRAHFSQIIGEFFAIFSRIFHEFLANFLRAFREFFHLR